MTRTSPETAHWTNAAPAWRRHADRIAAMTRPVSEALVAALAPRPGERMLDVACGVGDPGLQLARRLGPGGSLVALDGIEAMVATVAERAGHAPDGGARVAVVRAAAEALPFAADRFDGLACRFGAMFFADPARALAEMARVLRPGGRAALAVWGTAEENPYFRVVRDALDEAGAPPLEPPADAKTVFELAEPGRLAALAGAAGLAGVDERRLRFAMVFDALTPEGLLDLQRDVSLNVGERVAATPPATLRRAREGLARRLGPHLTATGLTLPAEAVLLTARA